MSLASRRLKEIILTTGALAGALCFVAGIASYSFGVTPLIVESGSMAPAITTGSLAIAREVPAGDLRVGDIVRIKTAPKVSVTHRIVKITHRPGSATLRLKGDGNKVPDAQIYTVDHVGRVLFSIPFAGRVVAVLSGPLALFLLGGYVAFVVMILIDERRERPAKPRGGTRRHKGGSGKALVTVTAVLIGGVGLSQSTPEPTFAAWTDSVDVGGTTPSTLTTHVVPASSSFACGTLGLGSVRVNWTAVTEATSYTVFYSSGASSASIAAGTTTYQITGASGGNKTAWVVANHLYGSNTWTSVASNTRTYSITLGLLGICS
jgi:signal peptidase I